MYSYEDRKKAVELYIKFDKSAVAVIRELGYPTYNMLKLWYREYLEERELYKKSLMQSGYTAE
jgi:transposase-like protein